MGEIPKVILLIHTRHAEGRGLLCGIARYAHDHGPWSFYWEPGGLERAWPRLRHLAADGIILYNVEGKDRVVAQRLPAVLVGHPYQELPGVASVVTDAGAICGIATAYLLGCGLRHFAFLGYMNTPWSVAREAAFVAQIQQAGFTVHVRSAQAWKTDGAWRKEREAIGRWLRRLPKPLGMLAANDHLGQEAIEAGKLAGLRVPEDLAVLGVDNDEVICGLSDPPMSSVAINFERGGYEVARALGALMAGKQPQSFKVIAPATHMVPRRSTDILAVEDPNLARALRFIRDHASKAVSVGETARAAGISQRVLQQRFRKLLNRSAQGEIRRVRTDQISRLLVETELPVARIAERLGFEDVAHFARYFQAGRGLAPLAYRKSFSAPGRRPQ